MKPKLNTVIIGAGGVASYMLPALNNSFALTGHIIDADILEEHNLDRQIFPKHAIGKPKAEQLIRYHNCRGLKAVVEYITDTFSHVDIKNVDVLICLVDNHPARRAALAMARTLKCPIVIGANEYTTSQAIYWNPTWPSSSSPLFRYPNMATSEEGSPIRCTGEALESDPQLAVANQVSAAFVNYLLWLWHGENGYSELQPTKQLFAPVEFQSTFGKMQSFNLLDTHPDDDSDCSE